MIKILGSFEQTIELFYIISNDMFQKTVNKALKKDAFKVSEAKGKFKYSGFEGNAYVDYLTNSSKTESPTNVLKAVLYTIADHGTGDWNFPFIIPFKDPRKLPASLKKRWFLVWIRL